MLPDHTEHAGDAPPAQPAPAQKGETAQAQASMSPDAKHAPGMTMAHGNGLAALRQYGSRACGW